MKKILRSMMLVAALAVPATAFAAPQDAKPAPTQKDATKAKKKVHKKHAKKHSKKAAKKKAAPTGGDQGM